MNNNVNNLMSRGILVLATVVLLSSCAAVHRGIPSNINNHNTQVVLSKANYKVIAKVSGSDWSINLLGILWGSFEPMLSNARSEMLKNAMLHNADIEGKPRAIIYETVEVNNKMYVILGVKTVTVSAYIIEFIE